MLGNIFIKKTSIVVRWICLSVLIGFVISIFIGTVLRYGFDIGFVKFDDVIGYAFGVLVPLCVFIAFVANSHVRVNFTSSFSKKINLSKFGAFSALAYFAIVVLSVSTVGFSWSILEGSKEPHGLGGLFLVKTFMPISFLLISIFLLVSKPNDDA